MQHGRRLDRFLGQPLLHFLLLGAAIFVAFSLVSKRSSDVPGDIVVTQGRIEHLHGHRSGELSVARFVDRAHAAPADQLELFELRERAGDLFGR